MIDLHCHLDLYDDPQEVAAECARRRLYLLSVTTTPSAFAGTRALANGNSRIRTALGLHPEIAVARARELPLFASLIAETEYVGEVGLDGSAPHRHTLDRQAEILTEILGQCAKAGGKRLTLHSRGATGLILDLLAAEPAAGPFVLHWYLGSARQIARAAAMGAWFSVGPTMLAGERGRKAVQTMPQSRVLPESDGPFGTVEDRPALPWDAWNVVATLASLWGQTESEVSDQLFSNFRHFVR